MAAAIRRSATADCLSEALATSGDRAALLFRRRHQRPDVAIGIGDERFRSPIVFGENHTFSVGDRSCVDEAETIRGFLRELRVRAPEAEIIVADGGSCDANREIAEPLCDRLVRSRAGRSLQMNGGARAAMGHVFGFLHADVEPPFGCLATIDRALAGENDVGGYFRIRLPRPQLVYRLTDEFAHCAGKLLRVRCGDHGFFCRRTVFHAIGGFSEMPLMEDVEFFRALGRCGRVHAVEPRLIVSPRRYETIGPRRLTFAFGLIATLYALGAPWRMLARLYERMCVPR